VANPPKGQLRADSRHVLTPRQLVGDPHDEFTDIGVGDRQTPVVSQLGGDSSDFLSGQTTGEQREQGDVVPLRNALGVACPQPVDDCAQEWGHGKL
jgi:hypothetical protein